MNITELDDQTKLVTFLELIKEGVEVNTAFVKADDSDVFTHQVLRISCGDLSTLSEPEPLPTPLVPAPAAASGQSVN